MAFEFTIETERMTLRQIDAGDGDLIFDLFNSPRFLQFIGDRKVRSVEEAEEYIRNKMLPGSGGYVMVNYVMIRKEDGVKMGTCGLFDREGLEGIDIGFALLPEFEAQGYAREAAIRVRDVAFTELAPDEVIAITLEENESSQKLLTRLGFTRVGKTQLPEDEEELLLYRLTRKDWENSRNRKVPR